MGDVMLTKMVFEKFLEDFREKGITTLEDILSLQGGSVLIPRNEEIFLPPLLDEAIKRKKRVKITYLSVRDQASIRVIDPLEITGTGDYLYLLAFCHLRQERRTFRLDRVLSFQIVEETVS